MMLQSSDVRFTMDWYEYEHKERITRRSDRVPNRANVQNILERFLVNKACSAPSSPYGVCINGWYFVPETLSKITGLPIHVVRRETSLLAKSGLLIKEEFPKDQEIWIGQDKAFYFRGVWCKSVKVTYNGMKMIAKSKYEVNQPFFKLYSHYKFPEVYSFRLSSKERKKIKTQVEIIEWDGMAYYIDFISDKFINIARKCGYEFDGKNFKKIMKKCDKCDVEYEDGSFHDKKECNQKVVSIVMSIL